MKGIAIDENYFQPDPSCVQKEQISGLTDKVQKLSQSLPLTRLLEYDRANAHRRYATSFSTDKKREWRPNTVKTTERLKLSIYEIGLLEVEVECIAEYDLVAQMQKDLQDQKE
jgi:hypothetical protein